MKASLLLLAALATAGRPGARAAAQAGAERQRAEPDKAQLRERLHQELNAIWETRETPRGLVVNIDDEQFEAGKGTLKRAAREKLARVAGILLAYPGLKVRLEGYTDNTGSPESNLKLSAERAGAVRDYLEAQGAPASSVTAAGLGEANPAAPNDTAAGRQRNRRVEMTIYGEPIGIEGGPTPGAAAAKP